MVLRVDSLLKAQKSSILAVLRGLYGVLEIQPRWAQARQEPSTLSYHSNSSSCSDLGGQGLGTLGVLAEIPPDTLCVPAPHRNRLAKPKLEFGPEIR